MIGCTIGKTIEHISNNIHFVFKEDNFFSELKNEEVIRERVNTLSQVDPYAGKYFSQDWIMRNVLQMTDEDIAKMQAEMQEENQRNMELQQQQMAAQGDQGQQSDQSGQGQQGDFAPNEPQLASDNMGGS